MQSTVNLQTVGLYTEPNPLTVPEGALSEATNVVIQRDNVIEPRRGFGLFGNSFGDAATRLKQLFTYKFRLMRFFTSTLEYDSGQLNNAGDEQFLPFAGSITEAEQGLRTKSIESNGNFYFTSSEGIKKISAASVNDLTTAPGFVTNAGGIKALDLTAEPIIAQGNITGFLPEDSTVAYRAVWGDTDLNKNLILGVPSQRAEVFLSLDTLLITDFNNTLQAIQNAANQPAPNAGIVNDPDYVSGLALDNFASADQVQTNMIALASKLDNDILISNDAGTAPLTISKIGIANNTTDTTSNVGTITFSAGNPNDYWIPGSPINLTGFPNGETGSINGIQTITSLTSTTITFLTTATGNFRTFSSPNVDVPNNQILSTGHGFNNFDPVQFTNSGGALPPPLVANTTYYLGNVTTDTFQIFNDVALASPVTLTGTGTGTNTVTYFMPVTNTSINSGVFENITQPIQPDNPATDDELVALQTYLKAIITGLQTFPTTGTPPIISAYSQTNYISTLGTTTTANVKLVITIPQDVSPNDFLQLYRSPTLQAIGTTPLSALTPSDELQQVYEAFPTAAELAQGYMIVIDSTPDQFLGADLYTNQASGVGIANGNETPPFALDINKFKNTVFYANTRTKYRMSLSLLGVSEMITDFNNGITPELVISDGITTNIYSFVIGKQQQTQVIAVADTSDSLNGTYFLINSGDNQTQYYVWYKTSGGTTSDPALPGMTGIEVFINTNDSDATVASKTSQTINTELVTDFTSTVTTNTVVITASGEGYTNDSSTGTSGFVVSTLIEGQGQKLSRETAHFTTVADVSNNLAGKYFTITIPNNKTQYYVWYKVSGIGTDPLLANATGIQIDLVTNDSAATVASKTTAQLNAIPKTLVASNPSSNILIVSPYAYGPANSPTVGTSGFTLTSTDPGFLQVLLSNNVSPAQAVDETSRSLINLINRNPAETLYAFYLSQSSTVPGKMTLESRNLVTPQYFLIANNSNTGSSFNPDLSPDIIITSITAGNQNTNLVTTATPHGLTTGNQVVISNTNSTPIVDGVYTIKYVSTTSFRINTTIISPSTQGGMTSGISANAGDNEVKINRIYYSALQQPESVPLPNTIDVGDQDKAILRIFPLRDSLFVFKEEGLYRISGETAPFSLQLFDSSCVLIAPDSLAVSKNVLYGWTNQGILSITEAGVSNPPISRPIDPNILTLTNENYSNFSNATWGIGYDSDNSYTVYTIQDSNDTEATIAYRYNTVTSTWTTFDKTDTCGIINIADDKMYLGAGDINFIEQERKSYTRMDYTDRELPSTLNIGNYAGSTIKLPSVTGFAAGDVLVQTQNLTVYDYNALLQKLNLDIGLQTNTITSITTGLTPTITTSAPHFLNTGDSVTLSGTLTTPLMNGTFQVTVLNSTQFQVTVPSTIVTAGIAGTVKYSYYDTLKISAGASLEAAVTALSNRLNIEPSLIYKTQSYSIVSNSVASPTQLTLSTTHDLGVIGTERKIRISGNTGNTPSINGDFTATVVSPTVLSIDVNVTVAGTGGTLTTLDDYITATSSKTGSITNVSVADPTIITAPNHGFVSDRYIQISGTNSTPVADGNYSITLIDENSFSIDLSILISGTTGSFATLDGTFQDLLTNYNYITETLNLDSGTAFKNYSQITGTTSQETIITDVNFTTKQITIAWPLDFVVGPLSIFKAITSTFTYSPVTFKDALNLKQVSEATLMFENKAFSEGTLSFKSDLIPEFVDIDFPGNGNGSYGSGTGKYGNGYYGGGANSAPFRTYIPRQTQRCRYIQPKFTHSVALEKYSINGLSLTGTIGQSSRAYR